MTSPRLFARPPDTGPRLLLQMANRQITHQIIRGVPGSLLGGRRR